MCAERIDSRRSRRQRPRANSRPLRSPVRTSMTAALALAPDDRLDERRRDVAAVRSPRLPLADRAAASTSRRPRRRSSSCTSRAGSGTSVGAACRPARCSPRCRPRCSARRSGPRPSATPAARRCRRTARAGPVAAIISWMPPGLDSTRTRGRPSRLTERASPRSTRSPLTWSGTSPTSNESTLSARALTSWARHGDQAAGPAALRVGLGQEPQHLQRLQPPVDRGDQRVDRGRVAVIAPGGQLGQGQVLADQPLDQLDVGLRQADRLRDLPGDRGADRGVRGARARAACRCRAAGRRAAAGRGGRPG